MRSPRPAPRVPNGFGPRSEPPRDAGQQVQRAFDHRAGARPSSYDGRRGMPGCNAVSAPTRAGAEGTEVVSIVDVHRLIAIVAGVAAAATVAVVVVRAWLGRPGRLAVDRVILAALVVIVANVAVGLVLLATGSRPADPLHFLYAVVALLALPIARFWGALERRRALALAIGGVVLVGLVVRLFQTG
jgi:hypothetical protein